MGLQEELLGSGLVCQKCGITHHPGMPCYPRVSGPAPVDDPAPYMSDKTTQRLLERGRILLRQEDSERRLTIAAQFMAAEIQREDPDSDLQPFTELAERAFKAADALIARWKETT